MFEWLKSKWEDESVLCAVGVTCCVIFGFFAICKYGILLTVLPWWGYALGIGVGILSLRKVTNVQQARRLLRMSKKEQWKQTNNV